MDLLAECKLKPAATYWLPAGQKSAKNLRFKALKQVIKANGGTHNQENQ
jgi:hypothetical protein